MNAPARREAMRVLRSTPWTLGPWRAISASLAMIAPTLLAFNLPPSSTFLNEAAALMGWGAWLTLLTGSMTAAARPASRSRGLWALLGMFALLLLADLASPLWTHLPWSLALSSAGMIAAAALVVMVGASVQREGLALPVFRAFCIGMVVAGVASSLIGIVQVFAPAWTDADWIARTYVEGRAVGNMRQPNHLSSLLLWAIVAAIWLGEAKLMPRWAGAVLALLFVFADMLTGSRTGAVSLVLLALWGLLDRRLSRWTRILLVLGPFAYAACWFGAEAWANHAHQVFGNENRFSSKVSKSGDISSSRWGIWTNAASLIRMHPWSGVGFGEFNFAWTLTPFPGRPVAFFDHTHNLPLHFAVELGLPLAALVLGLLLWALWRALRGALAKPSTADPAQPLLRSAAAMMVLLILFHSLLEYPLWYAYFLLPAAFAFGLCLIDPHEAGAPRAAEPAVPAADVAAPHRTRPLLIASMLLMLGALGAVLDYHRVVVIFAPPEGAAPLAQRIAHGEHSVLFAHHAYYAAATTEQPDGALAAFASAPHYLLDARLMQAWAGALDEAGDTERARYVAQRLREFRNEQSAAFFAPCSEPPRDAEPLQFQCTPPSKTFRYEDFR